MGLERIDCISNKFIRKDILNQKRKSEKKSGLKTAKRLDRFRKRFEKGLKKRLEDTGIKVRQGSLEYQGRIATYVILDYNKLRINYYGQKQVFDRDWERFPEALLEFMAPIKEKYSENGTGQKN